MDKLSHVCGPLWEEFKYLEFANELVEDHEELKNELLSLYEVCKDHFGLFFILPKLE